MAKGRRKKGGFGWQGQVLGLAGVLTAVVFMPTTIVLAIGMAPTIVAALIDRTGKGTKALTVGAMNLAGCSPFLMELWSDGHTAENAVTAITDPRTVIVIYAAAGIGYLINWAMAGLVGTLMVQRGGARLKDISQRKEKLIERWGPEVTGEIPLDPYGFPVEGMDEAPVAKKK